MEIEIEKEYILFIHKFGRDSIGANSIDKSLPSFSFISSDPKSSKLY